MAKAKNRLVAPADEMSDETFFKHFNLRHVPIGGLSTVRANVSDGVVSSMRAYHQHAHFRGYEDDPPNRRDVNHTHREL